MNPSCLDLLIPRTYASTIWGLSWRGDHVGTEWPVSGRTAVAFCSCQSCHNEQPVNLSVVTGVRGLSPLSPSWGLFGWFRRVPVAVVVSTIPYDSQLLHRGHSRFTRCCIRSVSAHCAARLVLLRPKRRQEVSQIWLEAPLREARPPRSTRPRTADLGLRTEKGCPRDRNLSPCLSGTPRRRNNGHHYRPSRIPQFWPLHPFGLGVSIPIGYRIASQTWKGRALGFYEALRLEPLIRSWI